jgi:hypothetical protein
MPTLSLDAAPEASHCYIVAVDFKLLSMFSSVRFLPIFSRGLLWTLLGLAAGCASKDSSDSAPQPTSPVVPSGPSTVALWLTTANKTSLFQKTDQRLNFGAAAGQNLTSMWMGQRSICTLATFRA